MKTKKGKSYKRTKEHRKLMSEKLKGRPKSKEHIRKSNETKKRLYKKGKLKTWNKGKVWDQKVKDLISYSHKKRYANGYINPMKGKKNPFFVGYNINYKKGKTYEEIYGKEKAIEIKDKLRKALVSQYNQGERIPCWLNKKPSKETIEKTRHKLKEIWKDNDFREKTIKKILKGLMKRPTSYEKIFIELIKQNDLPYKYVGDGSFLIGYKNPDFVDINGKKRCIEVYHPYFKERDYGSCEEYEKQRSKHFRKYGWKTIFIKGDIINDEKAILKKIK